MMPPAPEAAPVDPAPETAIAANGVPVLVARGIGGRLELYSDCIRIRRDGYVNYLLNPLAGRPAFIDTIIPIEEVSSFDIIKPVLFNDFVSIAYPGSPPLTGHSLRDSLAENALMMNFLDNRAFYVAKRQFQRLAARPIPDLDVRPAPRRRWRPSWRWRRPLQQR